MSDISDDLEGNVDWDSLHSEFEDYLLKLPIIYNCRFDRSVAVKIYSQLSHYLGLNKYVYDEEKDKFSYEDTGPHISQDPNAVRRGRLCGKLFKKGDPVYRCRDCSLDPNNAICSICFEAGQHEGHDVYILLHNTRDNFCGCGDPELWKDGSLCGYHDPEHPNTTEMIDRMIPSINLRSFKVFFTVCLDFIIKIYEHSPESIFSERSFKQLFKDERKFYKAFSKIPYASLSKEYALVVFDDDHHTAQEFERLYQKATGLSEEACRNDRVEFGEVGRKVVEISSDLEMLTETSHHFTKAAYHCTIRSALSVFYEEVSMAIVHYITLLVECQEFNFFLDGILYDAFLDSFATQLCSPRNIRFNIPTNVKASKRYYDSKPTQDDFNSNYDDMSNSSNEIVNQNDMNEHDDIDIENDPIDSFTITEEEEIGYMSGESIDEKDEGLPEGLISLEDPAKYTGSLYDIKLDDETPFYFPSKNPIYEENRSDFPRPPLTVSKYRLDWILALDTLFPKRMRREIHQLLIYSPLISDKERREAIAPHFFVNYRTYLLGSKIRKPQYVQGMLGFTVHLLTRPSIAKQLVDRMNFLPYLFALLERFFQPYEIGEDKLDDRFSVVSASFIEILPIFSFHTPFKSLTHSEFKNKLFSIVLQNLHYLLEQQEVQRYVFKNPLNVAAFLHFLTYFQGMNAAGRLKDTHVEYENEAYMAAFEISFYIYRIIRPFCSSYRHSTLYLAKALRRTIYKIDYWISRGGESSNGDTIGGDYCVKFAKHRGLNDEAYDIVDFSVDDGEEISFHYPLHWFLSLLLHNVNALDSKMLQEIGFVDINHLLIGVRSEDSRYEANLQRIQAIFDYPLRSIVLSSQIRVNLWVRNGQSVRAQCYSYRDMTDSLFYLDLFMLQYMLIIFPPKIALFTLLERFGLSRLVSFSEGHPVYDESQYKEIVLDFFGIFIYCLTERGKLVNDSATEELRRELLHNTLKPISFTDLDRLLPDRLLEECNVKKILSELCTFKPPETQKDSGLYTLKKEFYKEVNPYYFVSNRNARDHAEQLLKKDLEKTEYYSVPYLKEVLVGPFKLIGDILHEKWMSCIIFMTLYHALKKFKSNSLLNDVLYLYLIAAQDLNNSINVRDLFTQPEDSVGGLWTYTQNLDFPFEDTENGAPTTRTIVDLLLLFVGNSEFETSHPKTWHVLSLIEKYSGNGAKNKIASFRSTFQASLKTDSKDVEFERKKAEAKARLAKVRQHFAYEQKNFMTNQQALYDDVTLDGEAYVEGINNEPIDQSEIPFLTGNCLICAEAGSTNDPYGILAYVQPSKILSTLTFDELDIISTVKLEEGLSLFKPKHFPTKAQCIESSNKQGDLQHPPGTDGTQYGFHISSCGHMLHLKCMDEHYKQLEQRLNSNPARCHVENLSLREIVCPLCKSICNTILPIKGNLGKAHWMAESKLPDEEVWYDKFKKATTTVIDKFNEVYPEQALNSRAAFNNPLLSPITSKPFYFEIDPPLITPFQGNIHVGLNEPLSLEGNPFPFTALQSRRRATVLSPSRTGLMINEFMENITKTMNVNNGDPLKNKQLHEYFKPQKPTQLINEYKFDANEEFVNGLFKFIDIFRVCYSQRDKLPHYMSSWREYFQSKNLLDPIINGLLYTISLVEVSDRTKEPSALSIEPTFIIDRIPNITHNLLIVLWNTILEISQLSGANFEPYNFKRSISHLGQIFNFSKLSVLNCDPFHLLLEFSMTIVPLFKLDIRYIVKLLLMIVVTKLVVGILSSAFSPLQDETIEGEPNHGFEKSLYDLFHLVAVTGLGIRPGIFSQLWESKGVKFSYSFFYQSVLVFMRKVVLFLEAVQVPLHRSEDDFEDIDELTQLLNSIYLEDFPTLIKNVFQNEEYRSLIVEWCKSYVETKRRASISYEYPYPYKLFPLPEEFYSLFTACRNVICMNCNRPPTNPGICLICGTVICLQADCCRVDEEGEANQHKRACAGTIGMYLGINSGSLLMFHHINGSFYAAPYLDFHGETDIELRRGNQLYLNKKRHDYYLKLYLNHQIPQIIGRRLESNIDNGGWETF
ncbi:hypothetical protein K502DRAFT_320345 [Neoconidiobolus thromboides FSU 785]|nr:hypothetical protein K502DRAFT_320345 [Neoconidiobolus thromboides FSU 785]